MASQGATATTTSSSQTPVATINLPPGFKIIPQDDKLEQRATPPAQANSNPPLGVISNFTGVFIGQGFNSIFRPDPNAPNNTPLPIAVPGSDNVLELNLTTESLSFGGQLGQVPNRGFGAQKDILLNGVPYLQVINDVTNPATGKADGAATQAHFEPGLWMHVPQTTSDPQLGESLVRMASIPHGTTINAQTLAPTSAITGSLNIPTVDITPFNANGLVHFMSQDAGTEGTARIPQDLSKFITAGTITDAILKDPNTVLRNANQGKTITSFFVFTVSTNATAPELGGGTANIAFLQGSPSGTTQNPNADATQMSATFWIETVQSKIVVPVSKAGQTQTISPTGQSAPVPTFSVTPPKDITTPTTITVTSTQIQYSQKVFLVFNNLTWPHVSVATLVPQAAVVVPASAFP